MNPSQNQLHPLSVPSLATSFNMGATEHTAQASEVPSNANSHGAPAGLNNGVTGVLGEHTHVDNSAQSQVSSRDSQPKVGKKGGNSGRPLRKNRGQRLNAIESLSDIVGADLEKIVRKRAGGASHNDRDEQNQNKVPESIPENPMAPPAKRRRQNLAKPPVRPSQNSIAGNLPRSQSVNPFSNSHRPSDHMQMPTMMSHSVTDINRLAQGAFLNQPAANTGQQFRAPGPEFQFPAMPAMNTISGSFSQAPLQEYNSDNFGQRGHVLNTVAPTGVEVPIQIDPATTAQNSSGHSQLTLPPDMITETIQNSNLNSLFSLSNDYVNRSYGERDSFESANNNTGSYLRANFQNVSATQDQTGRENEQNANSGGREDEESDGVGENNEEHMLEAEDDEHGQDEEVGFIDEVSPSEDERNAEAFLHHFEQSQDPAGVQTDLNHDVIDEYRRRNRPNHPPSEQALRSAAEQQFPGSRANALGNTTAGSTREEEEAHPAANTADLGSDSDSSSEDEAIEIPKRSARHSRGHGMNKRPDTLGYYSGPIKEALEAAKKKFRGFVILHNGFPVRDQHLHEAGYVLTAIIEDFKLKGVDFGPGFRQTRDMNIVVFKEASTYRSKMKTLCQRLITSYYQEYLTPSMDCDNQKELQMQVADNVNIRLLGKENLYHRDGKDRQGRTNNLAHQCIAELCIQFYYGCGDESIARAFPNEFSTSIPEHAVALAVTCIHNCLKEWSLGYFNKITQIDFSEANSRHVLDGLMQQIEALNENDYHRKKWVANRRLWAKRGMRSLNPVKDNSMENATRLELD